MGKKSRIHSSLGAYDFDTPTCQRTLSIIYAANTPPQVGACYFVCANNSSWCLLFSYYNLMSLLIRKDVFAQEDLSSDCDKDVPFSILYLVNV